MVEPGPMGPSSEAISAWRAFDRRGGVRAPASGGRAGHRRRRRLAVPAWSTPTITPTRPSSRFVRRHAAGGLAPPRLSARQRRPSDRAQHLPAHARRLPRAAADRHDHRRRLPLRASSPSMRTLDPVMAAYRKSGIRVVLALSISVLSWTDRSCGWTWSRRASAPRSRRDPRRVRLAGPLPRSDRRMAPARWAAAGQLAPSGPRR